MCSIKNEWMAVAAGRRARVPTGQGQRQAWVGATTGTLGGGADGTGMVMEIQTISQGGLKDIPQEGPEVCGALHRNAPKWEEIWFIQRKKQTFQASTFNLQIESHQGFWRGCSPDELGAEGEADLHPCCGVCSKGHPGVISPHATLIFDVELLNLEWRQEVKQGGWRCLLLTLLSLLCHWDDTSRLGLLISVLTSLPHWHYPPSLPKLLCMCSVTVDTHLCLRKLQLQIEMFQVVHFSWCM